MTKATAAYRNRPGCESSSASRSRPPPDAESRRLAALERSRIRVAVGEREAQRDRRRQRPRRPPGKPPRTSTRTAGAEPDAGGGSSAALSHGRSAVRLLGLGG